MIIYKICQQFLISYSEIADGESLIGEKLIEVVHMFLHVYAYGHTYSKFLNMFVKGGPKRLVIVCVCAIGRVP